ncbi:hypothetical protein [Burkholderia sp. Bp9031]|uniref:hypothetical protein n=1 Tax=Burkholderia sp. Bp9031 TaxID=2184566 RepID=UPI00139625D1|nr:MULTISPECIES: hypothetical protein [Burkholderia]
MNLNQYFVVTWRRHRALGRHKHFWAARMYDFNRGHFNWKVLFVTHHDMILNVLRCSADSRAIPNRGVATDVSEKSLWPMPVEGTQRITCRGMQKCISLDKR